MPHSEILTRLHDDQLMPIYQTHVDTIQSTLYDNVENSKGNLQQRRLKTALTRFNVRRYTIHRRKMDMEMEGQAAYMQRLIRHIAEGNTFAITGYVRDIAYRSREVIWLADRMERSAFNSNSSSSTDVIPNNRQPDRWLEAIGVLFESAADYALTFEDNMARARVRGLLHIEVQELYRIAAMRHGGNSEEMDAEFDRLMSRNQSASEYQVLMRTRAVGLEGAEATQALWEVERTTRRASGRFYNPVLGELELANCLPYLLPGSITQLAETANIGNVVTRERRDDILARRWHWQNSGRRHCRIYRKRLMRWIIARWLQFADPATNDWVRLSDPIPLDDPLDLAELEPELVFPEVDRRGASIATVDRHYDEIGLRIMTWTYMNYGRQGPSAMTNVEAAHAHRYDIATDSDEDHPSMIRRRAEMSLPRRREPYTHMQTINLRYYRQA